MRRFVMGRYSKEELTKSNVIHFPGLKNRLFEKGIASLESHEYEQAISLFKQALDLDPHDSQMMSALLMALYERGDYEEAKEMAEQFLHQGSGDYYEILDIYLMILLQVNEYTQLVHTIEALFEEREVPFDKAHHFHSLLQLGKKIIAKETPSQQIDVKSLDVLVHEGDLQEQVIKIGALVDQNIQPYIDELTRMLKDETIYPFIQTMILNVLREHRYEKQVEVRKLEFSNSFIPAELPFIDELPFIKDLVSDLEMMLNHDNPILLTQLNEMIKRHAFILYPFDYYPKNVKLWSIAYMACGYDMYGEEWNQATYLEEHSIDHDEFHKAITFIISLEEISVHLH